MVKGSKHTCNAGFAFLPVLLHVFIFNTEFHVFNILYASKLTKQLLISLCTIAYPLDCDSSAFKMEGEKKEKKQGYHPHLTVMET